MAIFGPKPRVNPSRKMSIFWHFKLLVVLAQKGVFFVLEYPKRHFPGLYCLRRKVGNMAIFWPIPWVKPFGKTSIFLLMELLVFLARMAFFRSRIWSKTFSWPILPKNNSWKTGHFFTKTMKSPLWKNVNFSTFWTAGFYRAEWRFFVLEYRKRHFPGLYCPPPKKSWKNGHFLTF